MTIKQPPCSAVLRLVLGLISASIAVWTVFQAPHKFLWKVAIVATEWGHLLALVALLSLFPGWRRTRAGQLGGILGGSAAILLLTPLLRAIFVARRLPQEITTAFGPIIAPPRGGVGLRPAPLVAADLLHGVWVPHIPCEPRIYATRGKQDLTLDVYQPLAGIGGAPCVVVIHGGSWQHGTSQDLATLNAYLAAQGYVVAAVNYRLAPHHPFPAARDDILAALAYLKAHAAGLGLDPQRLVLLGRSAGGQLALLVAYTSHDPAIRGVISLYAPPDLTYSYEHPSQYPAVLNMRQVLQAFLGGTPDRIPNVYAAASPMTFVGPTTPPTLLIHGGRDELVDVAESERLARRLAHAGIRHLLLCLPWATHGGDFNFSGPSGQLSTYAIERFLATVVADRSVSEHVHLQPWDALAVGTK